MKGEMTGQALKEQDGPGELQRGIVILTHSGEVLFNNLDVVIQLTLFVTKVAAHP